MNLGSSERWELNLGPTFARRKSWAVYEVRGRGVDAQVNLVELGVSRSVLIAFYERSIPSCTLYGPFYAAQAV